MSDRGKLKLAGTEKQSRKSKRVEQALMDRYRAGSELGSTGAVYSVDALHDDDGAIHRVEIAAAMYEGGRSTTTVVHSSTSWEDTALALSEAFELLDMLLKEAAAAHMALERMRKRVYDVAMQTVAKDAESGYIRSTVSRDPKEQSSDGEEQS